MEALHGWGGSWISRVGSEVRMNKSSTQPAVLLLLAAFFALSALEPVKADPKVFAPAWRSLCCAISASSSAQTPESIAGKWVGEYRLDSKATYISVTFKVEKESVSGEMIAPLEDNSDRLALSAVRIDGNRVRFQTQQSDRSTIFEGAVEGGSMRGSVTRDNSNGSFELIHLARIDPSLFDNYVGDYETGQGRFIIVGRTLGSLYYFDEVSGRTGPLLGTSDADFLSGPSNGVSYPVDAKVNFQKDSEGSISTLTLGLGGAPAVSAKKVKLYNVEDNITFQNGGVKLSGQLKTPITAGPYPAIVMLAGSNAQSRYGQDCILGFNADFLARLGFAVLSYDKRGTGRSTGESEDIGLDGDALAGIKMLRQRKDIDPKRVGLWGISQGGMIAPQIAAQTDIAFIVSVSGAVVGGDQQEIERVELQMRADGFAENEIREAVAFQRLKFDYARTGKAWDAYAAAYNKYKDRKWFPDPYIGPPASKDDSGFEEWRKGVGGLSPGDYWEKYKNPALVFFGEFETYSKPASNIARLKDAMKKAGNTHYAIAIIPGAEHTMRAAKTGGPRELPYLNRFVPAYFDTLRDWLRKNAMGG
jgi:pimeloyl-ACP methyl ester carboxylesterase